MHSLSHLQGLDYNFMIMVLMLSNGMMGKVLKGRHDDA